MRIIIYKKNIKINKTFRDRVVSEDEGLKLGEKYGLPYIEADVVNGTNMEQVFYTLTKITFPLIEMEELSKVSGIVKKKDKCVIS